MTVSTTPPQADAAQADMAPTLSESELALLMQQARGARVILEYGTGHSTGLFVRGDAARILSVDSDPAWIGRLRLDPAIAQAEAEGRLSLLHADIGPVKNWGKPRHRRTPQAGWAGYPLLPWQQAPELTPDLVFVDGRFRLACLYAALLFGGPDLPVLVHDFWNRPHYHGVLAFAEVTARTGTLAALRAAPGLDMRALTAALRPALADWR